MVELAEIFSRHAADYIERFGSKMLPSHYRAINDTMHCRSPQMGGHLYCCENSNCRELVYAYHSCGNRSCPKCGQEKTQRWIETQHSLLLPAHYFLVTFTLPWELRATARSNQKAVYNLLFQSAAAALQKLAQDPRFVGGEIGMMGGLHTWKRDMRYHPHAHFIVPGGGLSSDRSRWLASSPDFLVHVEALSPIFRAKFRDGLKKTNLYNAVPAGVWKKPWVVHCKPVGNGHNALKYLAPYIYRVAITNNRIEKLKNGEVTFRYKDSDTKEWHSVTLPALEFIHRFLQHVLPKNFVKIRYYGLLAPNKRSLLAAAQYLLKTTEPAKTIQKPADKPNTCPRCGSLLRWVKPLPKTRAPP